jgi:hypothetical protein
LKPATEPAAHPTGALEPSVRRDAWDRQLVLDARAVGLAVVLIATSLRAPFVVVVVSAATATALVRLVA